MQDRNLILLVVCQSFSTTGSIVMATRGGIIGATLMPNRALSTLPLPVMVVAIAAPTILAPMLPRQELAVREWPL